LTTNGYRRIFGDARENDSSIVRQSQLPGGWAGSQASIYRRAAIQDEVGPRVSQNFE
jgi:hypothetical protein